MLIRRLQDRKSINALDNTTIREILNPKHESKPLVLNYSLAHATLKPNEKSLPHKFFEASEVYYILKGKGLMHIDDDTAEVSPGDTIPSMNGISAYSLLSLRRSLEQQDQQNQVYQNTI